MAVLRPFKAIRPRKDLVEKVVVPPYDNFNRDEAKEIIKDNPYSFLHIDRAEVDLDIEIGLYDVRIYEKARDNLLDFIKKGVFFEEEKPCFYIYRLTTNGRSQTGIVACASIDDYLNNVVKKHEHTREEKEAAIINYWDYCNANISPIFLTYRDNENINDIISEWTLKQPEYDFTSEDNIRHTVWVIDDEQIILKIVNIFKGISSVYIADGHHRAASAVKVGLKRREENPDYNGDEEFNYFLSVLFGSSQLCIMDYNRVVKDLNGHSLDEFLSLVSEKFDISLCEEKVPFKPKSRHTFGMYVDKKWYKITAKEGSFDEKDTVGRLDAAILQNNLLKPILGIENPRKSNRIDFVAGVKGLLELERKADETNGVAFSMYPPSIDDLMAIADIREVMPPKSTWFEPKLRSGFFIHRL